MPSRRAAWEQKLPRREGKPSRSFEPRGTWRRSPTWVLISRAARRQQVHQRGQRQSGRSDAAGRLVARREGSKSEESRRACMAVLSVVFHTVVRMLVVKIALWPGGAADRA